MGTSQSKYKKQQFEFPQYPPRPYPSYGPQYPPYGPQYPPMPGYGQQYPPTQPGFIPPGVPRMYGEGARLPPKQLNWMDIDKRPSRKKRKSRRRESERFVGGFAGESAPTERDAPRRAQSESHHRPMPTMSMPEPVIPGRATMAMPEPVIPNAAATDMARQQSTQSHRAGRPSPPYPPLPMPEPEVPGNREERLRRRQSAPHRYSTPPPIEGTFEDAIRPMSPPGRSAFGPTGERPRTPLRNPLPPPPRDLYEMSPYKSLLTLPQTTALLTANFGTQNGTGTGMNRSNTIVVHPNGVTQPITLPTAAPAPEIKRKKTIKEGLKRAFSRKEKKPEPAPQEAKAIYIPVFVPKPGEGTGGGGSQSHSTSQPADLSRSMSRSHDHNHSRRVSINPVGAPPISPTRSEGTSSVAPVPMLGTHPQTIRFDQDGPYNFFMNHSPHAVIYQNKRYPTALHLHEALKFIGHQDHIAEDIRNQDIWDVYPYASQYQDHVRPDWNDTYLEFMEEVLFRKFTQHPDLREKLLGTNDSRLIYSDPSDSFWGSGLDGRGENNLGQALERVRNKIRGDFGF